MAKARQPLPGDDEVLRDYTRVRLDCDGAVIGIAVLEWEGPHSPVVRWIATEQLPASANKQAIEKARQKLLGQPKFFVVFTDCATRHPRGYTIRSICHACMEQNHGVIF